jgi:hypothetical protein
MTESTGHMKVALSTGSKDPGILQIASAIELATGNKVQGEKLLAQAKKQILSLYSDHFG